MSNSVEEVITQEIIENLALAKRLREIVVQQVEILEQGLKKMDIKTSAKERSDMMISFVELIGEITKAASLLKIPQSKAGGNEVVEEFLKDQVL